MWIFLAFVLVPMLEIALFLQVGSLIGIWPTLLIVLLTAVAGTYMVKSEGLRALGNLQRTMNEMGDPSEPLAHGAMILFAGALLLTPGFATDTMGILLLIPAVRQAAFRRISAAMRDRQSRGHPRGGATRSETIIVDYEVVDETPPSGGTGSTQQGPSGWTQH